MSKILVVDDEAIIALQIEKYLRNMGYNVVGKAHSGAGAVKMAKKLRPDLILMDIVMPGKLDGVDAARIIKSELDIPVIFITAYTDDMVIDRAKDVEPFGYIVKPFKECELRVSIEVALYKKDTERLLSESEERYHSVVNTAMDAIISIDSDGKIISWNRGAENIFRYTADEAMGKLCMFIFPERFREKYKTITRKSGIIGKLIEGTGLRKNGSEFPMECSLTAWKTKEKDFFTCIMRDITDRKQTEDALAESKKRYEMATKAGSVGIWDWNLETNEIYIDPNLKAMLGYEDHEIQNHLDDWGKHVYPDDIEKVMAAANAHIEGLIPQYAVTHRMLHKDGSIHCYLTRGNVIRDKNGKPFRMIGTDTDITEQKQKEEALRVNEEKFRNMVENLIQAITMPLNIITKQAGGNKVLLDNVEQIKGALNSIKEEI